MELSNRPIGPIFFAQLYLSNKVERSIGKTLDGVDKTDRKIALAILKNPKYRISAIGFLAAAKDITIKETVGIILFTGLINLSDDYLDEDQKQIHTDSKTSLKNFLLSSKAIISGRSIVSDQREIDLNEIMERTLNKFTENKRSTVESFLNEAIENEFSFQSRNPGEYTHDEATRYRHNSSDRFAEVGLILANVTNNKAIEQYLFFAQAIDLFDDGLDMIDDCKKSAINPLIAYAFENGEGKTLSKLYRKNISSKKALKYLPKTRLKYINGLSDLINRLNINSQKLFFNIVSKLLVE